MIYEPYEGAEGRYVQRGLPASRTSEFTVTVRYGGTTEDLSVRAWSAGYASAIACSVLEEEPDYWTWEDDGTVLRVAELATIG